MVARILDAASAAEFTGSIAQLQDDVHTFLHTDAYTCWTVNRPAGWADGDAAEAEDVVESGTGKLYENGAGGPVTGAQVIHIESPYRFRALSTAQIDTGNLLVINGDRLFRVDIGKREAETDLLMNVYITELFDTPMPEVG